MMGSIYVRSLPTLPPYRANEGAYLRAFDDMQSLWTQINAAPPPGFTGPLLLAGGYALAAFTTDLAALKTAYTAANDATQNATIIRSTRDSLMPNIKARLQQYRKAVVGRLAPGNPLLATIPAYSPPPGSTPDPVSASGAWNVSLSKAVLTWTAFNGDSFAHYDIRTAPGPVYKTKDETSIDTVADDILHYETNVGLAAPGATALYRIYVVLTTGNEKGSATVSVTRPG